MTDKTEAQPEALRLAEAQRYSDVVHHANVKASLAYVARKTGLGYQETERLLELALQRGDLAEGDYSGRKTENTADDRLASLEAQLVSQTNRAAAAEQQVTALTQRLDMANRMNTDARNQLAQLSERQAAPDGWRLAPVEATRSMMAAAVISQEGNAVYKNLEARYLEQMEREHGDAYAAMLSAAPPAPEREPLTDEQIARAAVNAGMKPIYDKPKKPMVNALGSSIPFTWLKAFAHGIGATND